MICTHCGTPIKDGDRFCTECGAPAPAPAPTASMPAAESQPASTAAVPSFSAPIPTPSPRPVPNPPSQRYTQPARFQPATAEGSPAPSAVPPMPTTSVPSAREPDELRGYTPATTPYVGKAKNETARKAVIGIVGVLLAAALVAGTVVVHNIYLESHPSQQTAASTTNGTNEQNKSKDSSSDSSQSSGSSKSKDSSKSDSSDSNDDSSDSSDSTTVNDPDEQPSSTMQRYTNTTGGYEISVPDNFHKVGETSSGTGYVFVGSGVTITTWSGSNTVGSAQAEMERLEANAGEPISYDLNADPSIYVSYYKGGYVYYIKEIVYSDVIIGVQLKYPNDHRDMRDPLDSTVPPTLQRL